MEEENFVRWNSFHRASDFYYWDDNSPLDQEEGHETRNESKGHGASPGEELLRSETLLLPVNDDSSDFPPTGNRDVTNQAEENSDDINQKLDHFLQSIAQNDTGVLTNSIKIQSLLIEQLFKNLSLSKPCLQDKILKKMKEVHELIKSKVANLEIKETTIQRSGVINVDIFDDSGFEDSQNGRDDSVNFDDIELTCDNARFSRNDFDFSRDISNILWEKFGVRQFHPNQRDAINATLLGEDTFILMSTGAGKSLCYQLPGCLNNGLTLVISPLISLVIDQVHKLKCLDIPAAQIDESTSLGDRQRIFDDLAQLKLKFLFLTPEMLDMSGCIKQILTDLYHARKLARIVVDEAHCVSQWGNDFRPKYLLLKVLRENYDGVPIMALTATATPRSRQEIIGNLKMKNVKWFVNSFNRPNLKYSAVRVNRDSAKVVVTKIKESFRDQTGIVYCTPKKKCALMTKMLEDEGISVASFYATWTKQQKIRRHQLWMSGEIKVMVATIAFGMGIDKPDVRFVIHANASKSMENYYQESGRAGRDGLPAECIIFYALSDVDCYRLFIENEKKNLSPKQKDLQHQHVYKMMNYCEERFRCRRKMQLEHLGDDNPIECSNLDQQICDNCQNRGKFRKVDVTDQARTLLEIISHIHQKTNDANWKTVTSEQLANIFEGRRDQRNANLGFDDKYVHWGAAKRMMVEGSYKLTRSHILSVIFHVISRGFLREKINLEQNFGHAYLLPKKDLDDSAILIAINEETISTPSQKRKRNQQLRVRLPQINRLMSGGLQAPNVETSVQSAVEPQEFSLTSIESFSRMISNDLAQLLPQNKPSSSSSQREVHNYTGAQKALVDLSDCCFNELLVFTETMAQSIGLSSDAIASYENLFQLSIELPETYEDLYKIPTSRGSCFDVYGPDFIEITKKYSDRKKSIMTNLNDGASTSSASN